MHSPARSTERSSHAHNERIGEIVTTSNRGPGVRSPESDIQPPSPLGSTPISNTVEQPGSNLETWDSITGTSNALLPVGDDIISTSNSNLYHPSSQQEVDTQLLPVHEFQDVFEPGFITDLNSNTPIATAEKPVLMLGDGVTAFNSLMAYQIPKTPTIFSISGQQVVYMDFWLNQCLPALHPIFGDFQALGALPQIVTDTMMALSAGRLSRLLPQPKSFGVRDVPGLSFRPDATHKTSSQKYYYSALRGISDWVRQSKESQSPITLAVLVLFCCWESSMGNFQDFAIHSSGATKLIQAQENALIQQGSVGYGLMAAWIRARMNNWWRRMHFSTVDFQRKQAPVSIEPHVEMVLDLADDSKASVLVILCESLRIYSSAVVDYWDSDATSSPRVDACLYPYTLLMKAQSKKLSTWHTKVPLENLPITSFPSAAPPVTQGDANLIVELLRFQSHDSAMNYAYYVTARVIQTGSLTRTQSCKAETVTQEAEQWVFILLRIAAGIDWEACICLNTYAIGFSGLLLVCAIHSSNLAVGRWIQDWLEERQSTSHLEEGSFPVLQILQVLRAVNNERARGRDVYAVFQTVDDGGGEGKFHSYHSQTLTSVMVYGRNKESKELLSYSIPV
ncbi:hypothetical protein FDECE_3875 [Fusarium decemcellulare]|nr:hypothetical protein FDECE_3875 [Fusarium decemcellulare]